MKKRWTFVDTLIVILVIVAGVAIVKVFGNPNVTKGETKTIEAVVLLAREDMEVVDAISEGDEVIISYGEKDSGKLKAVKVEDAETMVYNAIDGKYIIEPVEERVDIYATLELEVEESDYAFTCGTTKIKVGEKLPFRGKGYSLVGYVIEINE